MDDEVQQPEYEFGTGMLWVFGRQLKLFRERAGMDRPREARVRVFVQSSAHIRLRSTFSSALALAATALNARPETLGSRPRPPSRVTIDIVMDPAGTPPSLTRRGPN